jgi:histone acetyltransferase (RNA polymerase elongator complex component)
MCLDIHDGEIIPIFCEKKNCDKIDCIFTHEDDKFHSEIYEEK